MCRLVSGQIWGRHPQFYAALEGLPVTITVFDEIKVGFKLLIGHKESRTLGEKDFTRVRLTVKWFGDQVKELEAVAQRLCELDDNGSR